MIFLGKENILGYWKMKGKDTEKVKRSDVDIWKDSDVMAENSKPNRTERNCANCQYVIYNVTANAKTEMNNVS